MKKEEIMNSVSTTFGKVSVKLKKHSPEILVVAGVVGTVASAVMACHARCSRAKALYGVCCQSVIICLSQQLAPVYR